MQVYNYVQITHFTQLYTVKPVYLIRMTKFRSDLLIAKILQL